ncbi:hypothetical protein PM082_022436 [Marasmius tenuissimus]|nr:hypothetical protein PM082_022436 [Marasmius tenuissimus]
MSSTSSSWISAFQNSVRISEDQPTSSENDSTGSQTPTCDGQISSFIFFVCGLERTNRDDTPILFDNIDATIKGNQSRIPITSGASFMLERATWQNHGTNRTMLMHGDTVALKFVRRRQSAYMNWKDILLEIRALLHSPIRYHPNIVRMIGMSWGAGYDSRMTFPVLVLEYAGFGTLEHLQLASAFLSAWRRNCAGTYRRGCPFSARVGSYTLDLKHENVLIFESKGDDPNIPYLAKLADFGEGMKHPPYGNTAV